MEDAGTEPGCGADPAMLSGGEAQYSEMIREMAPGRVLHVLDRLVRANDAPEVFRRLMYDFVLRAAALDREAQGTLAAAVPVLLGAVRRLEDAAPLLFLVLENLRSKKDECLRLRILEALGRTSFTTASILGLLQKADCCELVVEVLGAHGAHTDDFIRAAAKLSDANAVRSVGQIFPRLPAHHFMNYNSFLFLFESENHVLRCCMLDIIENLVVMFKEQNNVESIKELLELVQERLCDANFYVRGRALGCIAGMFRRECILKEQRNALVREIIGRVRDRTVIVRKKSVNILGQVLLNHPFRNKASLERTEGNEPCAQPGTGGMEEDFGEFVGLMETALSEIEALLEHDLKTDTVEIVAFIKAAYLLRLRGAARAFGKILGLVFTKDRQVVVDALKEVVAADGDAVYAFISNRAFDEALRHMDLDDGPLYRNFYSGHMAVESSYVLARLRNRISEANGLVLLTHATEVLFASRDETDLRSNTAMYGHALEILARMKERIGHNSELLRLASKNIIKMLFFECSLIKRTVQLFYAVSQNPEKNCLKLLRNLCLCRSGLKILDCVGWIAISQYYLLERLERSLKGQDPRRGAAAGNIGSEELENFRRSLGPDGLSTLRERRKSVEEARRHSLGRAPGASRMSLRFDGLAESMRDKTDEEVADFFFFLRENEVLGSETSLLRQFVPLVLSSCASPVPSVQVLAYLTLNRLMMTSSVFFNEHLPLFRASLCHESPAVRNNAAVALHDFVAMYGSSFDHTVVFDCLDDPCINRNIALVIHSLLHRNVIRVKNNAVKLVSHLFDAGVGPIVASIVRSLSSSNNAMSILFFETFASTLGTEYLEYLCDYVSPSIHEPLFLKCLASKAPLDRIKCVHSRLTISDKFMGEHSYREDVKALLGSQACEVN